MTPHPTLAPARPQADRIDPAARVQRGEDHPALCDHWVAGSLAVDGGRKAKQGREAV